MSAIRRYHHRHRRKRTIRIREGRCHCQSSPSSSFVLFCSFHPAFSSSTLLRSYLLLLLRTMHHSWICESQSRSLSGVECWMMLKGFELANESDLIVWVWDEHHVTNPLNERKTIRNSTTRPPNQPTNERMLFCLHSCAQMWWTWIERKQ